jgi:hypothetical protein
MELSAANAARLARLLCDLAPPKGAAEVRADGYLWIRTRTHGAWHRSVRIRGHESQAAAAWVAAYMAGEIPGEDTAPTEA